jgi:hypothetical protein
LGAAVRPDAAAIEPRRAAEHAAFGPSWQTAPAARHLPRLRRADCPEWDRWSRARHDALGHANAPREVTADLFGFLTTEQNGVVGAVHPRAMPEILTREDEVKQWLTAPAREALELQRPLPDDTLRVVARGRSGMASASCQADGRGGRALLPCYSCYRRTPACRGAGGAVEAIRRRCD